MGALTTVLNHMCFIGASDIHAFMVSETISVHGNVFVMTAGYNALKKMISHTFSPLLCSPSPIKGYSPRFGFFILTTSPT